MTVQQTYSGNFIDFRRPESYDYPIKEIAHALGNTGRMAGHTVSFYSVAQHSVIVARSLAPEFQLQGLMHDAHEAYVGDVPSPLKRMLPDYRAVEARVEIALREAHGLPLRFAPEVKEADLCALAWEKFYLCTPADPDAEREAWGPGLRARLNYCRIPRIRPLPPREAAALFLRTFEALRRGEIVCHT